MGSRRNRERAAAGLIFREGKLWKKEDWEAHLHPPPSPEIASIQYEKAYPGRCYTY